MTDIEVIHAYRHLWRGLLHAVQFSTPARYIARDRIRKAFREETKLDTRSVNRTVRFLEAAARMRGLEHTIVKNMMLTGYYRYFDSRIPWKNYEQTLDRPKKARGLEAHLKDTSYKHYDMTIAMLNKSMGLCLR
ncbi:DUF1763-domain-containing protein [Rostrohypoxylon terebratum]|nr:DUF1763-domain-containing protein [Rostrohypoxylon terebratum]